VTHLTQSTITLHDLPDLHDLRRMVQLHPSVEVDAVLHHDEADVENDVVRHTAVSMHLVDVEVNARSAGENTPVQLHPSVEAEAVLHHDDADADADFDCTP
jgi:hypothetical protein